jgi:hypothetical protein
MHFKIKAAYALDRPTTEIHNLYQLSNSIPGKKTESQYSKGLSTIQVQAQIPPPNTVVPFILRFNANFIVNIQIK